MFVIRKKLSADEVNPLKLRYNADEDIFEYAPDGENYVPAVGLDPRRNNDFMLPGSALPDAQCNGAANIVALIKSTVDAAIAGASVLSIANGVIALITVAAAPVGWIVDAVFIGIELIISLGSSALASQMTPEVYEALTCILACWIADDGTLSEENYFYASERVGQQLGGVPAIVFDAIGRFMGHVLFSNLSVTGDAVGDCLDCRCIWCYGEAFTAAQGLHGWELEYGALDTDYIVGTPRPPDGFLNITGSKTITVIPGSRIFQVFYQSQFDGGGAGNNILYIDGVPYGSGDFFGTPLSYNVVANVDLQPGEHTITFSTERQAAQSYAYGVTFLGDGRWNFGRDDGCDPF